MDSKQEIQNIISKALGQAFQLQQDPLTISIARPADAAHGDWATNVAMSLAKQLEQSPVQIASKLVDALNSMIAETIVAKVEVAGPGFLNFYLSSDSVKSVLATVMNQKDQFGHNNNLAGKTILIEHTSPNPNKEFHLGHLKNNVTGLSISYLLEAAGAKLFRDCIDNNRGIAIARLMWGYLKYARKEESTPIDLSFWYEHQDAWFTPADKQMSPGKFVDSLYVQGAGDAESNPESEAIVRQMVIDWEADEPKNHALWKLTQDWVWEGYRQSLGRVNGWKFDKIWHESDIYRNGKSHVQRGLAMGVFRQLEDGAILTDLKDKFNLTDTILIKKDGTALYITQDLELTKLKRETFDPDQMMWVIGPEQSLAMKQMFAACSQLGFGKYEDFHHIPYGFILIKNAEGKAEKMSSRKGTQIHVNDLIDQAKVEIMKFLETRDLSVEEKDQIAEKVAIGAVKYSLLKVTRTQDIIFDFDSTISFEGDSGPYLMYTYARAQSILRGQDIAKPIDLAHVLNHEVEQDVLKMLSKFPEAVLQAVNDYAPNVIANYVFDLAQSYNKFYNTLSVLNADTEQDKQARLQLTQAVAQCIKNGLALLGIETVEKM